jgi:hypothetical protein
MTATHERERKEVQERAKQTCCIIIIIIIIRSTYGCLTGG